MRGETADEIAKTLHLSLKQEEIPLGYQSLLKATLLADRPGCEMDVANRLWCRNDYKFQESFLDINRSQFGSEVGLVDFKQSEVVRKQMNDWVEKKTRNRIKDAVPTGAIHEMTRFTIINAIYFKGKLERRFLKESTKDELFHAEDRTVRVPMMALTDARHRYAEIDGVQILEKTYLGGDISIPISHPRHSHRLHPVHGPGDAAAGRQLTSSASTPSPSNPPVFSLSTKIDLRKLWEKWWAEPTLQIYSQ